MNNSNRFLDKNLTTIIIFGISFIVTVFIAEVFLLYGKLGAYSNLIVAFTSVCAILIALRQGEVNLRISRIDHKINAIHTFKIALFSQRVNFLNELRRRFEKIEEIIHKIWQHIPENELKSLNTKDLEQLKMLNFFVNRDLKNEFSLKVNDLKLFFHQSEELLSIEAEEISLKQIDKFIINFKSVIYFASQINAISHAVESFKNQDKTACKNYIKSRIMEQDEYTYLEQSIIFNNIEYNEEEDEINFLKFEQMLQTELTKSIELVNYFHDNAPWKKFKNIYEVIISDMIKVIKIEK